MKRGQALVLLALVMLLVCVMVLGTLGVGVRVRQRTELQTAADAAAYSQAVLTARTFNAVATLNRAQVALMVSSLAVQSLVSWSSYYRAALTMLDEAAENLREPDWVCGPHGDSERCACKQSEQQLDRIQQLVAQERARTAQGWDLDREAGAQLRAIGSAAFGIWKEEARLFGELEAELEGAGGRVPVSQRVALRAGVSALGPVPLNARERAALIDPESALASNHQDARDGVAAAMGSRQDRFVTSREGGGERITSRLQRLLGLGLDVSVWEAGSGYFGTMGQSHGAQADTALATWADDHGGLSLRVRFRGGACRSSTAVSGEARARSTDLQDLGDLHEWSGGSDGDPVLTHTLGNCSACSGVWPAFFNVGVGAADDVWSQPKTMAVLRRDVRPVGEGGEPWSLRFRFGTARVDLSARDAQLAASTALVYYHRGGHFAEPPTFFNPFWRATLVAPDVDERLGSKGNDLVAALDGLGATAAARTLRLLRTNGFKGLQ